MRAVSRRGFFNRLLGAAWTSAAVLDQAVFRAARARAMAQRPVALPKLFDFEKAAEGVFLARAKPQTLVNSNAVIFENETDLLIVDAHSKPSAAAALVRQIRAEVSPKPVRYVVATHFHWDHTQGLPAYRREYPRADVISSAAARKMMDSETLPRLKAQLETIGRQAEEYRASARRAKGTEEKAEFESMAREAEEYVREMREFPLELPSVTLDRDLTLHGKTHDLHICFRGRAHTAGDIVVFSPQKRVIASGDILHASAPFIGDGYPLEWPRTLLHLAELPFDTFCGGHGAVQRDRRILYQMANYIEEISNLCVDWKRRGRTLAEMLGEVKPAAVRSYADGGYGETVARTILAYRRIPPPRPTMEEALAEALRTNLEQVWNGIGRA